MPIEPSPATTKLPSLPSSTTTGRALGCVAFSICFAIVLISGNHQPSLLGHPAVTESKNDVVATRRLSDRTETRGQPPDPTRSRALLHRSHATTRLDEAASPFIDAIPGNNLAVDAPMLMLSDAMTPDAISLSAWWNAAIVHPRQGDRSRPPPPTTYWVTKYRKVHCGALVAQFCVWNRGIPRYFRPPGATGSEKPFTSGGGTTVCNEGGRKYRFGGGYYTAATLIPPAGAGGRDLLTKSAENTDWSVTVTLGFDTGAATTVAPWQPRSVLIVPFCWELYGYHLLLCLASLHAHLERLRIATTIDAAAQVAAQVKGRTHWIVPAHVTVGAMKGGSFTPWYIGSRSSWLDTQPRRKARPEDESVTTTAYWPLWAALVDDPANVMPLPDVPKQCFDIGIIGGHHSPDLTSRQARSFRLAVLRRWNISQQAAHSSFGKTPTAPVSAFCDAMDDKRINTSEWSKMPGNDAAEDPTHSVLPSYSHDELADKLEKTIPWHVTIVQRRSRYKILNVGDVRRNARTAFMQWVGLRRRLPFFPPRLLRLRLNVTVIELEDMTFLEQLRLIAEKTDVLVAVHGNALSWTMFLPEGRVVVELWPKHAYNANYAHFAGRANVRLLRAFGNGNCKERCSAGFFIHSSIWEEAFDFLLCGGRAGRSLAEQYDAQQAQSVFDKAKRRALKMKQLAN